MTGRAAIGTAFLAALVRPSWWLIALAGWLVRGGIVLGLLPIVAIPSTLAIANVVAPLIVPVVFGRFTDIAPLVGLGAAFAAAWLAAAGWLGAVADVALVRAAPAAAAEEGLPIPEAALRHGWRAAGAVFAVRSAAHLPLAVALALGAVRVVDVLYLELTRPFEVVTPLVLRVAVGAAVPLGLIVVAWFVGETVGGLASRRIVLEGRPAGAALRGAYRDLLERPVSTLAGPVLTTAGLLLVAGLTLGGAALTWGRLRVALLEPRIDPLDVVLALGSFVIVWLAALALIGLLAAWRSAAASFEAIRQVAAERRRAAQGPIDDGTFGAGPGRRPGDWSVDDGGGSL